VSDSQPSALDLIVGWFNTNTKWHAVPSSKGEAIALTNSTQKAWLYLEEYKRWDVPSGLYLLEDLAATLEFRDWRPRQIPPVGDPNFFTTVLDLLENGPKPF
jgi:hypothetical protein